VSGPKVVIIGAGSHFFGKPVIWNMATHPVLAGGTLSLVDTDADVLATMEALARRVARQLGAGLKIEATIDRREVLAGADFVIPSFCDRNAHFRGLDCAIAEKHGMRMCSGDTIGPGGIMRAAREVPTLLAIARDVEAMCPRAWVINFVNPSSVLGIALARHAPRVRSFALCDGPHEPHLTLRLLKAVGVLPEDARAVPPRVAARLDLAIAGVNHFSWVVRLGYDGRDRMPDLRAHVARCAERERQDALGGRDALDPHRNADAKAAFNATYALELFDLYGAYPDCIAHTKEYVPFWQGWGRAPAAPAALGIFDARRRQREMDARRAETRAYADGTLPIERFIAEGGPDHATDIIAGMWSGAGQAFRVNTPNRGAVPNLPDDAFLELACHLDLARVQPLAVGEVPIGVRGLIQRVLDCHAVTADAAAACDRALLLRAGALDPLTVNLADMRACFDELLMASRDALPAAWFPGQAIARSALAATSS
jgi:alpha-galactosidase/6-phospho-beta-glucosidase family protein